MKTIEFENIQDAGASLPALYNNAVILQKKFGYMKLVAGSVVIDLEFVRKLTLLADKGIIDLSMQRDERTPTGPIIHNLLNSGIHRTEIEKSWRISTATFYRKLEEVNK